LRDSLPVDMLLSAVSVLVVVQSSSEVPEGLMNNPVYIYFDSLHVSSKLVLIIWRVSCINTTDSPDDAHKFARNM